MTADAPTADDRTAAAAPGGAATVPGAAGAAAARDAPTIDVTTGDATTRGAPMSDASTGGMPIGGAGGADAVIGGAPVGDAPDRRLRLVVLLDAKDPARHRALAAVVAAAGHVLAGDAAARWDVALADVAAGEDAPEIAGGPLVLLSDHAEPEAGPAAVSVLPRGVPARQVVAALGAAAAGLVVRAAGSGDAAPASGFARDDPGSGGAALLTPREVEILALVGDGASNKAVARRLGISAHTVKFHLEAVFRKLGVATRAEAVARGLRQRLIEL